MHDILVSVANMHSSMTYGNSPSSVILYCVSTSAWSCRVQGTRDVCLRGELKGRHDLPDTA